MTKPLGYLFTLFAAVLAAASLWVLPKVQLQSDIMALFPQDNQKPGIAHANGLVETGVSDKLFFLLSSADWSATKELLPAFAETLNACDCIESVTHQQDLNAFQAVRQHYLQHAPVLLSEKHRVLLQQGQGEALVTSALRDLMANPASISGDAFAQDPLGTAEDFLAARQQQLATGGAIESGYLYFTASEGDRRYALVVADLADSPYSLTQQKAVGEVIDAAQAAFALSVPDADIVRTGAFFFARAGSQQAQLEISTVGLGSLLGVVLILLLVFRSLFLLLLAFLPVAMGVLAGLVATTLVFGQVHIVALVFGASLIGVSIDYSLHFLCKRQALAQEWQPELGLQKLLPGLTLGMLTSVVGYLSFTVAGFPGFRQIAVFSCAGLVAAYLVVVGLYPWLLRKPSRNAAPDFFRRNLPRYLSGARAQLRRLKYPEIAYPLAALLAIGLWQLDSQDEIQAMQTPNAELQAEETRFRELVGSLTSIPYLLVTADSEEALLQRLEQIKTPLQEAVAAGHLETYVNVGEWLPSLATQEANQQLIRKQLVETGAFQDYLNAVGVKPELQQQLLQQFAQPYPHLLRPGNTLPLLESLLARPLYFSLNGAHYSFVLLDGVNRTEPLQAVADAHDNVMWVDRVASTNQLLQHYRVNATLVLAVAYLVIGFLLIFRYGVRGALAVLVPPLLASLCAVSVLVVLDIGFSVFNAMALLLVLGIGIDYTLFMRESKGRGYDTLFAISLSTMTTILSFGLLSLSATHAIFSFGLTVLLGITLSFLLAPLAIQPRGASTDRRS